MLYLEMYFFLFSVQTLGLPGLGLTGLVLVLGLGITQTSVAQMVW